MISIGFIMGCTGALLIGLVLGHSFGEKSGYRRGHKACLDKLPFPLYQPDQPSPFPRVEDRPNRYDCILRIPNAEKPEDRIRLATAAAREISEKIARQLLSDKVIRPVIIESSAGYNGCAIEIGASIYAMANPTFNNYPPLVFFQTENT